MRLLATPQLEDYSTGHVKIRFNHYNKSFPIYNSILKWSDVDAEYSFSFVYRGSYKRTLTHQMVSSKNIITIRQDELGDYFLDLTDGDELKVEIEEDPIAGIGAEGLRLHDKGVRLRSNEPQASIGENRAVSDITRQLLAMDARDLHSDHAKRLREQRDIEDVLFST